MSHALAIKASEHAFGNDTYSYFQYLGHGISRRAYFCMLDGKAYKVTTNPCYTEANIREHEVFEHLHKCHPIPGVRYPLTIHYPDVDVLEADYLPSEWGRNVPPMRSARRTINEVTIDCHGENLYPTYGGQWALVDGGFGLTKIEYDKYGHPLDKPKFTCGCEAI